MNEYLKELFSEKGNASITRYIASWFALISGILLIYCIWTNNDKFNAVLEVMIGASVGVKVGSKYFERDRVIESEEKDE